MQDSSSHACRNVTLHTNVVVRFPKIFLRQPCIVKSKKKSKKITIIKKKVIIGSSFIHWRLLTIFML